MLADTAKLAIDLSLTGNARAGIAGVQKQLAGLDRQAGQIGKGFRTIGAGIGVAARNIALLGVAVGGVLVAGLIKSIHEGQEAAKVQTIYATAVRNSGKATDTFSEQLKVANAALAKAEGAHKKNATAIQKAKDAVAALTVRQSFIGPVTAQYVAILDKQQTALMNLAGVDDELIKSEQTRLIQMGLNGAAVAKLTPLILDFSQATGTDLLTATKLVGKSVNGNVGALARYGVMIDKAKAKTDPFTATVEALNQKFGGTTKALSGSLEARLGAFRENMANIREEMGMKLLPAITRIVDVAGKDLVPAFGKFVDRIMPSLLEGINKFADMLENGGAERGIKGITDALGPMVDLLKLAAAPIKAIVSAFLSLPSQVQGVLIAGFAVNKLSGGLLAKGVGEIAGGLFQRGGTPANPLFVMDVSGGAKGLLPALGGAVPAAGTAAGLGTAPLIAAAALLVAPIAVAVLAQSQGGPRRAGGSRGFFPGSQGNVVPGTNDLRESLPSGAGGGSLTGAIGLAIANLFRSVAKNPTVLTAAQAALRKGVVDRATAAGRNPSEAAIQRTLDKNATHAESVAQRIAAATRDTASGVARLNAAGGILFTGGGGKGEGGKDDAFIPRGPGAVPVHPGKGKDDVYVSVKAVASTRDISSAGTVKGRYGPTYTQAGAG